MAKQDVECPLPERTHLNIDEAQSFMGVGRSMLYMMLNDGSLKAVKIGKRILFSVQEMKDYLAGLPAWKPSDDKED